VVVADLLPPVAAFAAAWAVIALLLGRASRHLPLDRPNERSLHQVPVPRTGGIGLMAGALPALAWSAPGLRPIALLALGLSAVSLADDFRHLPSGIRLAAHLAAAATGCALILAGHPWWVLAAAVLAVGWMTNLYNFMDGSDGLAGGMAVFGFGACAARALAMGDTPVGVGCLCVVAGSVAFLRYNFHPGMIGIAGIARGLWPIWFPVLSFSPFVADATVTLARRGLRGERVWQAHREHYYQRLVRSGLGHRNTALAEYAVMLAAAASAVVLAGLPDPMAWAACALWGAIYVLLARAVDRRWRDHPAAAHVQ
jgi:UDP-GlcNAc:undecaprenyl-phosphate/decaprenyl-phosphate GlcNAc-1-phosphate transferase